jgi:hypothetical protein
VAILNVPIFDWPEVLATDSAYRFGDINTIIEKWARDRRIHYHNLLPVLIGRDIRQLRRSPISIHFNEEGHRLVGAEFKRFIEEVMDDEKLRSRPKPHRPSTVDVIGSNASPGR